jgi:hypothetical protein
MSKHTLEQVLEALLNKEEDRASELLHQFFVNKGKSIYEELSSLDQQLEEAELEEDEDLEEGFGDTPKHDFEDEIIADENELDDESLFAEADDEPEDPMAADEPTEPEATADLAMGDEEGAEGAEGAEGEAEEALDKVEDALAELKAAFAEIMGEPAADAGEEGPAMDMGDEEETEEAFDPLGESASLVAVPAAQMGDDGDKSAKSPVSSGPRVSDNGAKPVRTNSGTVSAGTEGGLAKPSANAINSGNVNVPGNKKAPALKGVATPKNSDTASNKTSPVAK